MSWPQTYIEMLPRKTYAATGAKHKNLSLKRKISETDEEIVIKVEIEDDDEDVKSLKTESNDNAISIDLPPTSIDCDNSIDLPPTSIDYDSSIDLSITPIDYDTSFDLTTPILYDNSWEIPTTSKKTQNAATGKQQEKDSIVEVKVGDKVFKINMNISQWIETHKNDFLIQSDSEKCTAVNQEIEQLTTLSNTVAQLATAGNNNSKQSTSTPKPKVLSKCTETDFLTGPAFEELSEDDKSLKAFFDSMLRATQILPAFHQGRIKADLVKELHMQEALF